MSHLLAKIMLALLMLPIGGAVYIMVATILFEFWGYNEEGVFVVAGGLSAFVVGVYWTLLWRSTVRWTRQRIQRSVIAAFPAIGCGVIVGYFGEAVDSGFGYFAACPVLVLTWLFLTVLIWRETPSERASRVRGGSGTVVVCPQCGYNLTGLAQAACPECGATFTLEELLGAQPGRDADLDA